eukprot:5105883-Prymnesium_polylepis.1
MCIRDRPAGDLAGAHHRGLPAGVARDAGQEGVGRRERRGRRARGAGSPRRRRLLGRGARKVPARPRELPEGARPLAGLGRARQPPLDAAAAQALRPLPGGRE